MYQYNTLLRKVLTEGETRGDRTGTGTTSLFGATLRHDMREGFPLLTAKRVPFKSVAAELLWFIDGGTNIRPLLQNNCTIWTDWPLAKYRNAVDAYISQKDFEAKILDDAQFAAEHGSLGPVYGKQWRQWDAGPIFPGAGEGHFIDQIGEVLDQIRHNPESRRILVSAWNPGDVPKQALPPCHFAFQLYCHTDGRLSLQMHMRSTDIFLGLPFNIASYGLLLHMLAAVTDRTVGDLIITFGDLHLYSNHLEQALEFLSRPAPELPTLDLPVHSYLEDYTLAEITASLKNYNPLSTIRAQVAV